MNFSCNFFILLTKFVFKVSVMAQVIKKYIFLSGAKSNDPLHIDCVPNVFKFTKMSAKRTQESLKRYERKRPNVTTNKIFTAPYISNDLRLELGKYRDKGTRFFRLFSLCLILFTFFTQFYHLLLKFLWQI